MPIPPRSGVPPKLTTTSSSSGNFGYQAGKRLQLYSHVNFAGKKATGGFYFRNPNTRDSVFSSDGGQTLLIGDALDASDGVLDGCANCPVVPIVNDVPDSDTLDRVFADLNCCSFQEIFPGGFTPQCGGTADDAAIVVGVRLLTGGGGVWDASVSMGSNEAPYFIHNSVNASLGQDTPTSFDLGTYGQQEVSLNLDVSYLVGEMINVAGGAEWRRERFTTGLGQRESWEVGPSAAQGFSAASNGFPGFGPLSAGVWSRSNVAAYADAELQGPGAAWTLGAAVRVAKFEDFSSTVNE